MEAAYTNAGPAHEVVAGAGLTRRRQRGRHCVPLWGLVCARVGEREQRSVGLGGLVDIPAYQPGDRVGVIRGQRVGRDG